MSDQKRQQPFGLIVVGDEILSGRRQDKHFPKIVEMMSARGLQLSWVEIHGDDRQRLTDALKRSFASGDIVICCGGIGATPDDHTRQAAAAALGLDLALHPEAREQITLRVQDMAAKGQGTTDMNAPENQQRLQMGYFPMGSEIVPNPYNRIPGFFHPQSHLCARFSCDGLAHGGVDAGSALFASASCGQARGAFVLGL